MKELAAIMTGVGMGIVLLAGATLLLRTLAIRDIRAKDARRAANPSAEPPGAF